MSVFANALPPAAYFFLTDENAFEVGRWEDGALHTRVPDSAVNAKGYRLVWVNILRPTAELIRTHYNTHAAGIDGESRLFQILPPGGTAGADEIVVLWGGRPSFRRTSAKAYRGEGFLLRATASDFEQGLAAAAVTSQSDVAVEDQASDGVTTSGALAAPQA